MNIFELSSAIQSVWELVQDEDMDMDVLEDTLQSLECARDEKAEGYAKIMKQLEAQAEAIKTEEKRLSDRRKSLENKRDRMKQVLEQSFEMWGVDKIKTLTLTVAMQNNPPSVLIADENSVPEQFVSIETVRKIDRKSLLQALKEGEVIGGCSVKQSRSLRIR